MNETTDKWITAKCLCNVEDLSNLGPGDIIAMLDKRYLIIRYDGANNRYLVSPDPGPYPSLVLWRAVCSCGYRSSLGSAHRASAREMAYGHSVQSLSGTHNADVEPYWHS